MSDSTDETSSTFIPVTSDDISAPEDVWASPKSMLESIYWQSLGWVHTPPFLRKPITHKKLKIPSTKESELSSLYWNEAFAPKLQIESHVPHGIAPREVSAAIEREKISQQDLGEILKQQGLTVDVISPPILYFTNDYKILRREPEEGIPTSPFLKLETFDDHWFYETRSPEEWMSLGTKDGQRKPVPGIALVPSTTSPDEIKLDWKRVGVINYDSKNNLYLVRNEKYLGDEENSENKNDVWIPRVYLKFGAEDGYKFAERLQTAVITRQIVEETIRLNYYIENMPDDENIPTWSEEDLNHIRAIVRCNKLLQSNQQWIKDEMQECEEELQIVFKKSFNALLYTKMIGIIPNFFTEFKNAMLGNVCLPHKSGTPVNLNYQFSERFEKFRALTFWNKPEIVTALNMIQIEILSFIEMSLFELPVGEIITYETFNHNQKSQLQAVNQYVHGPWIESIANAITSNAEKHTTGSYDLNQTVIHTFKMTKIGKLLKQVSFKMQDVMRSVVVESLEQYYQLFKKACEKCRAVRDAFVWKEGFMSKTFEAINGPIFEVGIELKNARINYIVDLHSYFTTVLDIFDQGLQVTSGLPRPEKLVMKKLLYDPELKVESVSSSEKNVTFWKKDLYILMSKAVTVATAYVHTFDSVLKYFKEDTIDYVKRMTRLKISSVELKQLIEMHHQEGIKMADAIPRFVDIGPFRLMTESVRTTVVQKHEQLSSALMDFFYDKFRSKMEDVNDQFLILLANVDQGTGNIEDLLEKKTWCRTVPNKVQSLSIEINILRSDCKLIATFDRNLDDEDFSMYWQVQSLPLITIKRLETRVASFAGEYELHKTNLAKDLENLSHTLENLKNQLYQLEITSDLSNVNSVATEIRRMRKDINLCEEKAQLYNKREVLFRNPPTDHPQLAEISKSLVKFELFWLNAAEFYKVKERIISEDLEMEAEELKIKIMEFRDGLAVSVEYFDPDRDQQILNSVLQVMANLDEFMESKWMAQEQD